MTWALQVNQDYEKSCTTIEVGRSVYRYPLELLSTQLKQTKQRKTKINVLTIF